MRGLDCSFARPGGTAIRAAGFDFCMRYVPYEGAGGKGLTVDELTDLRTNGLAVGLVFESTGGRMLDGSEAGQSDAKVAQTAAAELGFPDTTAIYFTVDFDAQPNQYDSIDAYLAGAASVLGPARVGVYGSYAVIEHCHEAGTATWFWQTYGWSGGKRSDWNHVYQYLNGQTLNGAAVDYDDAAEEFGQWKPEEEFMPTKEEWENLVLAFASGSEERVDDAGNPISREQRLVNANARAAQIANLETYVDQDGVTQGRPSLLDLGYELKGNIGAVTKRMDAFSQRTVPGVAGDGT